MYILMGYGGKNKIESYVLCQRIGD